MVTSLATWWNNVPATIRDFVEAIIAAAVGGAVLGLLSLNLDTATVKQVEAAVVFGAVSSVIAFARHRLAKPSP